MKCRDCSYWDDCGSQETSHGYCRRYAPRPVCLRLSTGEDARCSIWPEVHRDEWCGEFVSKQKENE